jgi:hypothetical protein
MEACCLYIGFVKLFRRSTPSYKYSLYRAFLKGKIDRGQNAVIVRGTYGREIAHQHSGSKTIHAAKCAVQKISMFFAAEVYY